MIRVPYYNWNTIITITKGKSSNQLECKCSIYEYDNKYRACFKTSKQTYYFEIDYIYVQNTKELEEYVEAYFLNNRNSDKLQTEKCIRCSKHTVLTGVYCERCKEAIKKNENNSSMTVLDEEL
jgi:hypothetical protein